MQKIPIETKLPKQSAQAICRWINNSEKSFAINLLARGSDYLFGTDGITFLVIRSEMVAVENSFPENLSPKSILEILRTIDLPKRVAVAYGNQDCECWLFAIKDDWLCLQGAMGRFWLISSAVNLIRWDVVEN